MKSLKPLFAALILTMAAAISSPVYADSYADTLAVFKKSDAVRPFFNSAYGYAVFPTVGKGGIVVGGAFGKGRVYKKGSLSGNVALSKLSVGFQLGGQAFSQVIFFRDKRAYDEFTGGSFEFDASVSAVAITAGVQAKAGTEGGTAGASAGPATGTQASIDYYKGMAVFVHAKGGLMYEISIGGQKFDFTPL
ncbi:MAG: lipid-binding SYLF domain-containing protein [Desulfobacter sp.]